MTTTSAAVPSTAGKKFNLNFKDFGIVFGLAAIMLFLTLNTGTFLTGRNFINLFDQAAVVGLLAAAATLCIISGVFDLSSTATLAVSAISGVMITQHFGVAAGFFGALLVGALLGSVTGLIVVSTKVNSFIGTLAVSIIYRGLAIVITGGAIVAPLPDQLPSFQTWTWPSLLGLTAGSVLMLAMTVVLGIVLWRTTFGRRIYAVGGNQEAARLSGIRTGSIHVAVFAISGLCSAMAGMILASRAGSAQPAMAIGIELTAIAAVVIGGTSILGGQGAMWRAFVGVMILTVISNGFNLLHWDTTYQQVVTGVLILVAVAADGLFFRKSAR
ncbi:ABC transporter permease [Paenarthrobacter ureafaciens]|jgi:ribose transport system permease protein|uniref:ABC transporter permease n=1 Tax=Paenarthrobacter ureafaciens TaxID=37931 RepID=UPI00140BCC07|nr:ABC transporter permease [Paenarthrobacter ureafaciens]MCX8453526.1 ABC transporter permease [Paenarthrobacter ureafaciens]MCY0973185.1 ABC transporter permease [Paenarthrobacter ureafaciens]QQQ63923.1 ABC transporter permease [Paenarthrobacter ureafaciens]UOD82877.1 ABC transporter permease [Paenarthrobacter ureafaciens]WNZ02584.1 ABC transporter permease [Paenarthrobacter ureafaciens]